MLSFQVPVALVADERFSADFASVVGVECRAKKDFRTFGAQGRGKRKPPATHAPFSAEKKGDDRLNARQNPHEKSEQFIRETDRQENRTHTPCIYRKDFVFCKNSARNSIIFRYQQIQNASLFI